MTSRSRVWTIVVAAGTGTRFGGAVPKQFVKVVGRRIVEWSVATAAEVCDGVVVVMPPDGRHDALVSELRLAHVDCKVVTCTGGVSRSASVRNGLAAVGDEADFVLVHDAARPVASTDLYQRVIAALQAGADAVVPAVPVVDTLRDDAGSTVDRSRLRAVQTPQGFAVDVLRRAHEGADDATDDATLANAIGAEVVVVAGERWNLKVTESDDRVVVAALLAARGDTSWIEQS